MHFASKSRLAFVWRCAAAGGRLLEAKTLALSSGSLWGPVQAVAAMALKKLEEFDVDGVCLPNGFSGRAGNVGARRAAFVSVVLRVSKRQFQARCLSKCFNPGCVLILKANDVVVVAQAVECFFQCSLWGRFDLIWGQVAEVRCVVILKFAADPRKRVILQRHVLLHHCLMKVVMGLRFHKVVMGNNAVHWVSQVGCTQHVRAGVINRLVCEVADDQAVLMTLILG